MRAFRRFFARFANLFGRRRAERDFAAEIGAHLALMQEEFERRGMAPEEARRAALVKLGGVEQAREMHREARSIAWIESFVQDVRFALRMLRKNPGFTTIAVVTLALGIGANTAIFSVVNAVLLNPLPYSNPGELVEVAEQVPPFLESSISYPNFLDWVRENRTFQALAAYREREFNLTGAGDATDVKAMQVSASFFPLLNVRPVLGRNFTPGEDTRGAAAVAMLGYGLWKTKFDGSPGILGRAVDLDGTAYTVIGVIPPDFYFCCKATDFRLADVYVPIGTPTNLYDRSSHAGDYAVGRLKPGVTLEQARADMGVVARNLAAAYPDVDKDEGVSITPLKERMVQDVKPMLLVVLAAVGLVLLIACVNVANLLLARSTGRAKEFAVRAALGASQSRIVSQLLTESLLLATAGGGLGVLLASLITRAGLKVLPEALPRADDAHLDLRVLLFTLAASVAAGILFGLAPALKTSHPDVQETLKEGGRGASGARHRTQGVFVVAEIALALLLLIGAGLTIRSLARLWAINPGFDPNSVLTFTVALPPSKADETPDEIRERARQLTDSIAVIPGVEAAALSDGAELMHGDNEWSFWVEGRPKPPTQSELPEALAYVVSPDYWKVLRITLLRGRLLTREDDAHSRFVGVIDENFARAYFPGQDPVGKLLNIANTGQQLMIVGVVGHVNQWGLDKDASGPVKTQLYTLAEQFPEKWIGPSSFAAHSLVVRTAASNYPDADAIRRAVAGMNRDEVAYDFESMNQVISDSLATRRFSMILLGAFAAIALLLASIGIYGVVSYVVGQRTREIGIRLALGAQKSDVMRIVLGDGARYALIGVGIGLITAAVLTRFMTSMLFGVSAIDPLTFVTVSVLLCGVALAACYIPARRAMRVDPMVALRHE